jgi:hypothetical protein
MLMNVPYQKVMPTTSFFFNIEKNGICKLPVYLSFSLVCGIYQHVEKIYIVIFIQLFTSGF